MATKTEIKQLHDDLAAHLKADPHANLSSTQMILVRRIAQELLDAHAGNTAAKAALDAVGPGKRLLVSDGLAVVGQLLASIS